MKNVLIISVLLCFSITSSFGQGVVDLKKQGAYDWVKDYDHLVKTYSSKKEKIGTLQGYFYNNGKPKTNVSFDSLKMLYRDLEKIFAATPKPDKLVGELKVAIRTIILNNPNGIPAKTVVDTPKPTAVAAPTPPLAESEEPTENIEKLQKDKNLWFWLCMTSLGGFVGLLLLYLSDRKSYKEELRLKTNFSLESQNSNFNANKNEANIWKEKYAKLEVERNALSREHQELKEKVRKASVPQSGGKPPEVNQPNKIVVEEPLKQFYLSIPTPTDDGFGSFRDMRQTQANPNSSFYRFEVGRDENKAKFWFLDNPNTIQSAVIYPETYINPVCNYEGFNSNAKRIITKNPGFAVKEGDIWKVRTKAEIRFE